MIINIDTQPTEAFSNKLRDELLSWVNNTLKSKFMKIEELCTGAAYCQLIHSIFPNSIAIRNVKFVTNVAHECFENFKILEKAFQKLGVLKTIPISRLCSGRFRENFEFLVWFRAFFDANATRVKYDPVAVRKGMPMKYGPVEIRRIYEQREKDALKDKVLLSRMKAGFAERASEPEPKKRPTTFLTKITGGNPHVLKRSATQTLLKSRSSNTPRVKFLSADNSEMDLPIEPKRSGIMKRNNTQTLFRMKKNSQGDSKAKDPFTLKKRIKELERLIELKNRDDAEKDIELVTLHNENNILREELREIKRDRDIYFDKMHRVAVCCRDAQYKAEYAVPISTVLDIFLEETLDPKRKLKTRSDVI